MAKLATIKPVLGVIKPRLGRSVGDDRARYQDRDDRKPWRKWYKLTRWQRLRLEIFQRDLFTCQMPGCSKVEADTSRLVADHIEPHRGDPVMFWSPSNIQCLCKPCHDGEKQSRERAGAIAE